MAEALVYRFQAVGHTDVARAFGSITDRAIQQQAVMGRSVATERRVSQARRQGAMTAQQVAQQVAKAKQREEKASKQANDRIMRDERRMQRERLQAWKTYHRNVERQNREHERRTRRAAESRQRRFDYYGGLARTGASVVGAAGAVLVGAAARRSMRVQDQAIALSTQSRDAGGRFIDPNRLRREAEVASLSAPGIGTDKVLEAMSAFVTKTGDIDTARANAGTFATVASAADADIADVSAAAADLFQKFDIRSIEDMSEALGVLYLQGKKGAFELEDAAAQFGKVAGAAKRFGFDKGIGGVATLGGLMQIARQETPSGEEASTALENALNQLVAKSDDLSKQYGIQVFADKGKTKTNNIEGIIASLISNTGGDIQAFNEALNIRGSRAFSPLVTEYNRASQATKGTKAEKDAAGVAAVKAMLQDAIQVTGSYSEVQKDAAHNQQRSSAALTAAWDQLTADVGSMFGAELAAGVGDATTAARLFATALAPAADVAASAVTAIGHIASIAQKMGFIEAREDLSQLDPMASSERLGEVNAELNDLAGREKLTASERMRQRDLEDQQIVLERNLGGGAGAFMGNRLTNARTGLSRVADPLSQPGMLSGQDALMGILGPGIERMEPDYRSEQTGMGAFREGVNNMNAAAWDIGTGANGLEALTAVLAKIDAHLGAEKGDTGAAELKDAAAALKDAAQRRGNLDGS